MPEVLKVGIAGLGTVGSETFRILTDRSDFLSHRSGKKIEVTAVSAKNRTAERDIDLSKVHWIDDARDLCHRSDVDVIVELIGGSEGIAREIAELSLKNGKSLITANKALIAHHGDAIGKKAEEMNLKLGYEAAVAGGIPIIKTLREGLASNKFTRLYGILNGTCNYILTRMENANLSYEKVFKEAKDLGYLEADPTLDVGGIDAGHKLAILSSIAFGTEIDFDSVYLQGIESITIQDIDQAKELGYRIKLLGVSQRTDNGLEQRMQPCLVPVNSPIGQLENAMNMVIYEGDNSGQITLSGAGAGEGPTASSVLSDIIDLARDNKVPTFGKPVTELIKAIPTSIPAQGAYYVRTKLKDSPGVLAKMASALGDHGISIDRMRQTQHDDVAAPVVIVTHKTLPETLGNALTAVAKTGVILEDPVVIRIEDIQ